MTEMRKLSAQLATVTVATLIEAVVAGTAGPWGRGAGRPYSGLTRSGAGHRAVRYGYRWEVGPRFNVGIEGARIGGFGGLAGVDGRGAGQAHSVQVRGRSGSERIEPRGHWNHEQPGATGAGA